MNLTELTNYVWAQTDTTEFDLPAATIANYIDEAFARTIAAENEWPFYEKTWTLNVAEDECWAELDTDVNRPTITSVYDVTGKRLTQIAQEEAERRFGYVILIGAVLDPDYYSFWGNQIMFWPAYGADEAMTFGMRGYRKPLTTFAPDGQVDADARLHRPLAHYAVALAYAAQEDEVLERTYMERWQKDVELARRAIMQPERNRPVVMHGDWPRTPVGGRTSGVLW